MRTRLVLPLLALPLAAHADAPRASRSSSAPSTSATTQTAPPRVHHILFEVADLARAIAFYRDRFDLRLDSRSADFAVLSSENVGVCLWQQRWSWEARKPGERVGLGIYPHLEVADVGATVERLRAAGVKVVQEKKGYDWGDEAFVADPDGYVWALVRLKQ